MPRNVKIKAQSITDYFVTVAVPDTWTDKDVIDYYEFHGANGEFDANGEEWIWHSVTDADDDDEIFETIGDWSRDDRMDLKAFVESRYDGNSVIYYAGGHLCIFPTDDPDDFIVYLNTLSYSGALSSCEKILFETFGNNFCQDEALNFEPDPKTTGFRNHKSMTDLLEDYCGFYGITNKSADELAVDEGVAEVHRDWFAGFVSAWDAIPEPKKKWVCNECGSESIYWDASAYWDAETNKLEMSDAVCTSDNNFCGDCGAENKGYETEVTEDA